MRGPAGWPPVHHVVKSTDGAQRASWGNAFWYSRLPFDRGAYRHGVCTGHRGWERCAKMRESVMNFRGVVIDGPQRGQIVEKPSNVYQIHAMPMVSVRWSDNGEAVFPSGTIETTVVCYVWSRSLGQWAMVY